MSEPPPDPEPSASAPPPTWRSRIVFAALALAVLAGAGAVSVTLLQTAPMARRDRPARTEQLVEVTPVEIGQEQVRVVAYGTVRPAREVALRPRVSGEVVRVNPQLLPGGFLVEGDLVLQIDPRNYQLALAEQEGSLAQAESAVRLEAAQRQVAERELELMAEDVPEGGREVVLRRPQRTSVRAAASSARARVSRARLDRGRTVLRAPFDSVVRSRAVEVGALVSTVDVAAHLIGTAEFWVEVSVPVRDLEWIRIPRVEGQPGAPVRIYAEEAWGEGEYRTGEVLRLAGELERDGRMARLIVRLPDPLALSDAETRQLLVGSFVRVEIDGDLIEGVAAVDRRALRGTRHVWLMRDDQLEVREVHVAWEGRDRVFVDRGLEEGESLITSALSAPVEGMALRVAGERRERRSEAPPGRPESPGGT